MSGGKGGSQTTEVKVPEYIEAASKANLARANEISKIGYARYNGPDVAAFTPMQQAAFQNTADTASQFGLAAPTSQQGIMGGMPAPTTYAGGVQGYSSAPMFEQSVADLKKLRPGQYDAIMAQFLDPLTGSAPSATSVGGAGPSATSVGGAAAGQPMSSASIGSPLARVGDYGGMADQGRSNFGGGGNAGAGGYTGLGDMMDRGGPNAKGGAFSGGGALSAAANAVAGGDGPGGDKVICTALHELGRLSDEMYALDAEFGLRVNREDPMLGDGYRLWATSVAEYIKGDSPGSKVALAIVSPVARAWAAEMAHVMRPDNYKSNIFGKALMVVGHPTCRMIGKAFLPKVNKEIV